MGKRTTRNLPLCRGEPQAFSDGRVALATGPTRLGLRVKVWNRLGRQHQSALLEKALQAYEIELTQKAQPEVLDKLRAQLSRSGGELA